MGFDLILNAIGKHILLTKEEELYFTSLLQYKRIRKKELHLSEGQICLYSTFVTNGCLRGYTVDKNGQEHVLHFAPSGWWIADLYSFISQKPGNIIIEAIEDTETLILSKSDQEKLYLEVPKFERFFRIIIENSLVASQQRLLNNLSLTAEERYIKFCKTYPTLVHLLPQKQVASFLGVTPEFFSKMRTNVLKKQ